MLGKDYVRQDCSIARALEVVGERWTLLIVRDAFYGVRRFNDFQVHLDIPKAVLSDRLSGLVERGILDRTPDPDHAGRHVYELTAAGRELWPLLFDLMIWGSSHRSPQRAHLQPRRLRDRPRPARESARSAASRPSPADVTVAPRPDRKTFRDDPVTVALRAPHRLLVPLEV